MTRGASNVMRQRRAALSARGHAPAYRACPARCDAAFSRSRCGDSGHVIFPRTQGTQLIFNAHKGTDEATCGKSVEQDCCKVGGSARDVAVIGMRSRPWFPQGKTKTELLVDHMHLVLVGLFMEQVTDDRTIAVG